MERDLDTPSGLPGFGIPAGPVFVDTGACRCALRRTGTDTTATVPSEVDGQAAWRCLGNVTAPLLSGTSGKWFLPTSDDLGNQPIPSLPANWNGDSPDADNPRLLRGDTFQTIPDGKSAGLSLQDAACTGKNDTTQSTELYKALNGNGAGVCLVSSQAIPTPLQTSEEWNDQGCLEGFYCPNNTINRPPVFCPPQPACLAARLGQGFCTAQGWFEPAICRAGYYCPPNAKEMLICPAGNFCPSGVAEPQPCGIGAYCPEKSVRQLNFLPLGLLVVFDLCLVMWHVFIKCSKRKNRQKFGQSTTKRIRSVVSTFASLVHGEKARMAERSLPDPELSFESRIQSVKRVDTGFLSALEDAHSIDGVESIPAKPDADMRRFVDSISKCMSGTRFGLSFEFENLSYSTKREGKVILSNVTGRIDSGALWAVMGASGAGKSTFVNVLMGKISHIGGTTKVNGNRGKISSYRRVIGYVPQDDILLAELTVYENILHSARIRLPSSWQDTEVQEYVDVLIRCLQLHEVKDSIVGSPAAPVISGGQRKRVSIGMELAGAPMALFLDEPTSGLDSAAASSIMGILKALTKVGITVVAIIHQPRQEIFESLDNLLLLGAGRMLYQGRTSHVKPYFESVGFEFPVKLNPADVVMDIIAGQGALYKKSGETKVEALINNWSQEAGRSRTPSIIASPTEDAALHKSIRQRGAYFHRQVWLCLRRAMVQQLRFKDSFYYELAVGAIAGFLIGLSFFNEEGQNFVGLFHGAYGFLSSAMNYVSVLQYALLTSLSIGLTASSPGVKVFGEEKLVYYREAASGHNRFAYYIGKVISTLPRMFIANLHFTILSLLLSTPLISTWVALAANLLYFYCVYGLASIVSMLVRREDGPLIATVTSLIVGVLSGVSPTLRTVDKWHVQWLWRMSPGTWLAEIYFTENVSPLAYLYRIDFAAQATGYTMNQLGLDMLMLFVLGTAYRIIAFAALRLLHRHKQR